MIEEERIRNIKREKADSYAQYVKETYWPSVSTKKVQELENAKNNIYYFQKIRRSIEQKKKLEFQSKSNSPDQYTRPWRVNDPKLRSIESSASDK